MEVQEAKEGAEAGHLRRTGLNERGAGPLGSWGWWKWEVERGQARRSCGLF